MDIATRKPWFQVRCVDAWQCPDGGRRVYHDWGTPSATSHDHPPATARMPATTHYYNGNW